MYLCMYGWMDGGKDVWMDGWMELLTDQRNGCEAHVSCLSYIFLIFIHFQCNHKSAKSGPLCF